MSSSTRSPPPCASASIAVRASSAAGSKPMGSASRWPRSRAGTVASDSSAFETGSTPSAGRCASSRRRGKAPGSASRCPWSPEIATRILLAEDHLIVRQGVRALLEREGFQVVAEASDGHEAIRLARDQHPDVAVLDLAMPRLNGLDAAREIHRVTSRTRTILLTVHTERQYILQALQLGIRGCVIKTRAAADLIRAIREVSSGRTYLSPDVSHTVVEAYLAKSELPRDPLSLRERQVLQLVAEGRTTKEIARVLGVSVKTAECHRCHIMNKLDIHDIAGLVRYAIRTGFTEI